VIALNLNSCNICYVLNYILFLFYFFNIYCIFQFYQVEVANPANKKVNLGALRIGQTCQKSIQLVNRSPATITFTVAITPTTIQLQQDGVISVSPTKDITLRANGGTGTVDVLFKPKGRIPQFTEEVSLYASLLIYIIE